MKMGAGVLALFLLGLGGCGLAGEGFREPEENADEATGMLGNQDSCSQYCDRTYPEHTYPNPEDHSACERGCRMAHMDALIAWPFKPDVTSCRDTCAEAYPSTRSRFACRLGCNVSTIDQLVPDRNHIYPTQANSSEFTLVMELLSIVTSQLPQFMVTNDDVAQLTQHAEMMYRFIPCGGPRIIHIEDTGDIVEIQYSPISSSDHYIRLEAEEDSPHTSTYHFSCPWKSMHYAVAGRLLFFVAVGLIAIALFTCCCASFMPEEGDRDKEMQQPRMEPYGEKLYIPTHLKSPVTFVPGFPQPVPYYSEKKSTHF